MNQSELARKLQLRLEEEASITMSKASANAVFKAVSTLVADLLKDGYEVSMPGLGKFSTRSVPARVVISPLSGQSTKVPWHLRVRFSASSKLKKALR